MITTKDEKPVGHVLIFGATGSIGRAIGEWFHGHGYKVTGVSRQSPQSTFSGKVGWVSWDASSPMETAFSELSEHSIDAVIWAQGMNLNDSIMTFNLAQHMQMYEANVSYILISLQALISKNLLSANARLCVISSIWQNLARQNKMSYCITKSALQGLVQSLSIDLGKTGCLINAVLPGALDTPMTRANLSPEQIDKLEQLTPTGSLPALDDVCELVGFLCSSANTGITGQFIKADRGFSHARII